MSKITESARGEECDVRLPFRCSFDNTETVWSHINGISLGKGMGQKNIDEAGVYSCYQCHLTYERRLPPPVGMTRDDVELATLRGHIRSLRKLKEKGLI